MVFENQEMVIVAHIRVSLLLNSRHLLKMPKVIAPPGAKVEGEAIKVRQRQLVLTSQSKAQHESRAIEHHEK